MPRILVSPMYFRHGAGPWREVLDRAGFETVIPPLDLTQLNEAALVPHLEGIDGVIASVERYSPQVLKQIKVRAIARSGVGYDSIDVPAATECGVVVTTTPGTNEHSVAEQAYALIFGVFRDVAVGDRELRQGVWRRNILRRLAGCTLGLVGLGRIGKAMVPRAIGLGLKTIAYDPFADRAFAEKHGVRLVSLDELLAEADIVSLHMPCTPETMNIINATTLAKMKSDAVLINTSRGGLVDEDALIAALEGGKIGGAGLDVFKVEPLPATSPFLKLDNVVVAPHKGGLDQDSIDAMGKLAAECLVNLYQGQWPDECVVNKQLKAGWKW